METKYIKYQDLNAYEVQDETMRVVILPDWGGKIVSLYDKRHHREWLHINRKFDFQRLPTYEANYIRDFDIGGFDECFPNIGAGPYPVWPWKGISLPDHGEVWALPWNAKQNATGLSLSVYGVRLPYRLEKRIELRPDGLWMSYRAVNRSQFDMPFVWSSHPLVNISEGMYLEVPASTVRVDSCNLRFSELTGVEAGQVVPWPQFRGKDLSVIPGPEAQMSAKLISRELNDGNVSIVDPAENASLTFRFDPKVVTHCGMWLNYGGWAGKPDASPFYNVGFEPCIGVADRLDIALDLGEAGLLPASDELNWYLHLLLK